MNRILIVDDKAENLYLLRVLLQGHGYEVDEARHGAEALVKARQAPPHLVVSDLLMPVMDGYTLLQHWKTDERLQRIPFVVYTATYTEPKDERLALDLGADAFIVKPTEPDVFMARLQEVLARQVEGTLPPSKYPQGKEEVLLKQYNEVLIRRLELKMEELERTNRELERDITERQRAETQVRHLNEVIRAARAVNQLIGRERDPQRLLEGTCSILLQTRGYRLVWIGRTEPDSPRVVPAAFAGDAGMDYLQQVTITWDETASGRGPIGTALRERAICVCANTATDPNFAPWREPALARGYASVAAAPLIQNTFLYGALAVYADRPEAFDTGELALLNELAGDLAFALRSLEDARERARAEQALRESEVKYRRLYDFMMDAFAGVDMDGRIQNANRAFQDLLGYSEEELRQMTYRDLTPDRWHAFESRLIAEQVLVRGDSGIYEKEYRRKDGTVFPIELRTFLLRDSANQPVGMWAIIRDITERKRVEAALKRERNLLRTLIDHVPDFIFVKDLEGHILLANRAMAESIGKSDPEDLVGLTDADLHSAELAAQFAADEQAVLRSGQALVNREEFVLDLSGNRRWLLTSKVPLRDTQARIVGLVGVGRDITERKRAEEALHRSETLLVQAGQMASLGAWEIEFVDLQDLTTNPLRWSEEVFRIFGYQPGEVTPTHDLFLERVHSADRPRIVEAMQEALRTREPYQIEHRVVRPDGTERVVLELAHIVFDPQGRPRHMIGAVQDITERKRLEQEHVAMEAKLRQQQKLESIGTLASGVAHEINNPIMGIMNYAQLIVDKAAPDDSDGEYATEIIRETERVAGIVKNLLQFARHEKQTHSPARMTDIVDNTLSLLRAVLRHDQIDLSVDLPSELPTIKCRSQQIQQVLMNLLTNARDTLNEKYPGHHLDKVIQVTCQTFEKEGRRWVRLTVEDHGCGIPETIRTRILDPFFTTKPRDMGTGLGLSISHGIVRDHHGVLSFETEPGRWTRFHVDLPVDNEWRL